MVDIIIFILHISKFRLRELKEVLKATWLAAS